MMHRKQRRQRGRRRRLNVAKANGPVHIYTALYEEKHRKEVNRNEGRERNRPPLSIGSLQRQTRRPLSCRSAAASSLPALNLRGTGWKQVSVSFRRLRFFLFLSSSSRVRQVSSCVLLLYCGARPIKLHVPQAGLPSQCRKHDAAMMETNGRRPSGNPITAASAIPQVVFGICRDGDAECG